ncbi:MAG: hypothetical protein PHV74_13685 [Dehalococcoidia bacterium]|nr:hypothetical protein [Dehalococcoidia bacterium]
MSPDDKGSLSQRGKGMYAEGKQILAFLQKGSALVLKLILGCDRLKLRLFDLR